MIHIEGVRKAYGKRQVLQNVSLEVQPGQCIGILGANGCGKSTLLSILAGVQKADGGIIEYFGEPAQQRLEVFTRYTGYVPQENPLIDDLSVIDNLRLWYGSGKKAVKEELKSGLPGRLGLAEYEHFQVKRLSGGMKKRLSIACALVRLPQILIMDEPNAALDLKSKQGIYQFINEYLAEGGTILLTTHEEADLDLCSHLYVMKDGELAAIKPQLRGSALVKLL